MRKGPRFASETSLNVRTAGSRGQLPLLFLFGPLVALMPIGYFVFELGRSIERDRRVVAAD